VKVKKGDLVRVAGKPALVINEHPYYEGFVEVLMADGRKKLVNGSGLKAMYQ